MRVWLWFKNWDAPPANSLDHSALRDRGWLCLPKSMSAAAYDRLVAKLKRVHYLGTVAGLLGWDEQVNLPPDSADQRAEHHVMINDQRIDNALADGAGDV